MNYPIYEHHDYNERLPVIFHYDTRFVNENTYEFFPNWHGAIEVLYFKKGIGNLSLNGEKFSAFPEDIVVINSNVVHTITPEHDSCEYYCLIIDKKFIEKNEFPISHRQLHTKICDKEVTDIYANFCRCLENHEEYYVQEATGYLYLLLSVLFAKYTDDNVSIAQNGSKDKIEITKKAITFIQDNFHKEITIEDISAHCHISKFYFCRTFKEVTGITPVKFINSVRCTRARDLLLAGEYSVAEISGICGFESPSYFTKTFKNFYGVTPTSFKNK